MVNKSRMFIKIALILIVFYVLTSFMFISEAKTLSEMQDEIDTFMNAGAGGSNINYTNVTNEFKGLGQILTMIGAGVMVGVTAYMGIKYLTAGPEAQAKLKVQLIGVVVAGMVIFGAYYIWSIVLKVVSKF